MAETVLNVEVGIVVTCELEPLDQIEVAIQEVVTEKEVQRHLDRVDIEVDPDRDATRVVDLGVEFLPLLQGRAACERRAVMSEADDACVMTDVHDSRGWRGRKAVTPVVDVDDAGRLIRRW